MSSIQVQNICKRFGSFTALNDVSLDFPSGQLVGLLGPSGCGKTTLLRIIAGLESADSGRVLLDGEDASHAHVRERQVGFVFQHYALFRHMTVFENVAFGLRVKPRKIRPNAHQIRCRVQELLELVQLDWLATRYPHQLSGGQRQRVALARALAVEPRVLLLDEPFGALDAKVRKELRRWLRELHNSLHISSIFVTHDQEEALEVSDQVVLMNRGSVEQIGTPSAVYEHPASPFVYSFLGAVNLFHGRVQNQQLQVGSNYLPVGDTASHADIEAMGFVRPHELEIDTSQANNTGVEAQIMRILAMGAITRIELHGTQDHAHSYYEVELPRERAAALSLVMGQIVRLKPMRMQVFAKDDLSNQPIASIDNMLGMYGDGI